MLQLVWKKVPALEEESDARLEQTGEKALKAVVGLIAFETAEPKLHRGSSLDQEARPVVGLDRFQGAGEETIESQRRVRSTARPWARPYSPASRSRWFLRVGVFRGGLNSGLNVCSRHRAPRRSLP